MHRASLQRCMQHVLVTLLLFEPALSFLTPTLDLPGRTAFSALGLRSSRCRVHGPQMIRKVTDSDERPSRKNYLTVATDAFITLGGVFAVSRLAAVAFAKLAETAGPGPIWPQEKWNKLVRNGELSEEGYRILHDGATEPPFSSDLNSEKRNGTYICAACKTSLFSSETKFDSGSGWPSFYEGFDGVIREDDNMVDKFVNMRAELRCSTCGGHLGHVFGDGLLWKVPTGERMCVNGAALDFLPAQIESRFDSSPGEPREVGPDEGSPSPSPTP